MHTMLSRLRVGVRFLLSPFQCWNRKFSDKDEILLTPWEQWRKYRGFPFTAFLHTAVLVLCIVQVMLLCTEFTPYNRSNELTFKSHFYPEEWNDGIYTQGDCIDAIQQVVDKYYSFPGEVVSRYQFLYDKHEKPMPPLLTVTRYQEQGTYFNVSSELGFKNYQKFGNFATRTEQYLLTADRPLGPLGPDLTKDQLQTVFYSLVDFTISFNYFNLEVGIDILPWIWTVLLSFDMSEGGQLAVTINTDVHRIVTGGFNRYDLLALLTVIIFLVTLLFLWKSVATVRKHVGVFRRLRSSYKALCHHAANDTDTDTDTDAVECLFPTWRDVPRRTKVLFLPLWAVYQAFVCLLVLTSCVFGVLVDYGYSTTEIYNISLGLSCLMLCVGMIRYLGSNKMMYTLSLTWSSSIYRSSVFIMASLPIFLGYVLFGMLNFSQYSQKFMSIDETAVTLFALLNGDDIHNAFNQIVDNAYPVPFVSRLYLYTFIIFFITSVLNVFIMIIEDAYHISKLGHMASTDPDRNSRAGCMNDDEHIAMLFQNVQRWRAAAMEAGEDVTSFEDFEKLAGDEDDTRGYGVSQRRVVSTKGDGGGENENDVEGILAQVVADVNDECAEEMIRACAEIQARSRERVRTRLASALHGD